MPERIEGTDILKTVLGEETPDHGLFVVRRERWRMPGNPDVELRCAYNKDGHYVGNPDEAICKMLVEHEVVPELKRPDLRVCSVGKSRKDGKWYGWSHRCFNAYDDRNDAVKFADEVARAEAPAYRAFESREEAADFAEEATELGDYTALYLDPEQEKIIKKIVENGRIKVLGQQLHVSIFQSNLPGFRIRPVLKNVTVTKYSAGILNGQYLVLFVTSSEIIDRYDDVQKKYATFCRNNGREPPKQHFIAHLTLSDYASHLATKVEFVAAITKAIKNTVGALKFTDERVRTSPIHPGLKPKPSSTPESNRKRLGPPKKPGKETSSMRQPARIVPRRKATDPLNVPCANFEEKLADLYERRKIAALVGQARTVQNLNANIRQLRAANGMDEDPTTRPTYVGTDSNIDPRGGLLTEQSRLKETAVHRRKLRGHKKIMESLLGLNHEPDSCGTLNVLYDLDWSKGHTMRGMASVYKILNGYGYVARKFCPEPDVHAYEFSSPDGTDRWSFTCARGADWCFEVRHNDKLLGGTFTIRPGAPVEEQGIPESMMRDDWAGVYEPIEAQRYTMAWRNVLAMIRSHVEKVRPRNVNLRGA